MGLAHTFVLVFPGIDVFGSGFGFVHILFSGFHGKHVLDYDNVGAHPDAVRVAC